MSTWQSVAPNAWILGVATAVLGISFSAKANDTTLGRRGHRLVPVQNTEVQMRSEAITIRFVPGEAEYAVGRWVVEAHYRFVHHGDEAQSVEVGFPELRCPEESDCSHDEADFKDLQVSLDGRGLHVREEQLAPDGPWGEELDRVWTFEIEFQPGQTHELVHRYSMASGHDVCDYRHIYYVVGTGAQWAGPIEDASFEFVLPSDTDQLYDTMVSGHDQGETGLALELARIESDGLHLRWKGRDWTPEVTQLSLDFSWPGGRRVELMAGCENPIPYGLSEAEPSSEAPMPGPESPVAHAPEPPPAAPSSRCTVAPRSAQTGWTSFAWLLIAFSTRARRR